MAEPFLAQIVMFGGNFAPRGWAYCDGQLLPIAQNTAVFSLLGTTYGGDGRTTFALPDLRGRLPMHPGSGPQLTPRQLGQKSGSESNVLTVGQLPAHGHQLDPAVSVARMSVSAAVGDQTSPVGHVPAVANDGESNYAEAGGEENQIGVSGSTADAGGGQPVNNLPPFLCVNFIIALQGVFPSRN
jgi:microcystin-dependent protein